MERTEQMAATFSIILTAKWKTSERMVPPVWHRWRVWWPQALGGGLQLRRAARVCLCLSPLSLSPFLLPCLPPSLPISRLSSPSFLLKFSRIILMLERTEAEKPRSKTKQGIMSIRRHGANPQSCCGRAELHPEDSLEGSPWWHATCPQAQLRGCVWRLTSHHSRSSEWVFDHQKQNNPSEMYRRCRSMDSSRQRFGTHGSSRMSRPTQPTQNCCGSSFQRFDFHEFKNTLFKCLFRELPWWSRS